MWSIRKEAVQPIIITRNLPYTRLNTIASNISVLIEPNDHLINSMVSKKGEILEYRHLIYGPDKALWEKSLANDISQLV